MLDDLVYDPVVQMYGLDRPIHSDFGLWQTLNEMDELIRLQSVHPFFGTLGRRGIMGMIV